MKSAAESILKTITQWLFSMCVCISVCVCVCMHRDDTIPHTGLPLSIHSLEVIIFNFCPHWPVGRWLAWMPFYLDTRSGQTAICWVWSLNWQLHYRPALFSYCLQGLQIGCTECELLQNMGLFVIFTLLSFYDHPVNISPVKSWLNQTVPKKQF